MATPAPATPDPATPASAAPAPASPRRPPGPRGLALLRAVHRIGRDPLGLYAEARRDHGDLVGARVGPWNVVLAFHPDAVRHVLHDRHALYHKQNVDYRLLKPVLGEGLVTSDGELWRRQRRLIQPSFQRQRIAAFAPLMTARAETTLARLDGAARTGDVVDVAEEMRRLTLEIATGALFRVEGADLAREVGEAFTIVNRHVLWEFQHPLLALPGVRALPIPESRRARAAVGRLDAIVARIVAERRRRAAPGDDLLAELLAAHDERGGMSDRQLRDEVMTMLLAGHETTANGLAWTWHLLAGAPAVADRLAAEATRVLGERAPTAADVPQLAYTRTVIDEALRLYPPVWTFSRTPREDDEILGYRVPAGAVVVMSPWITHRHPEFWPDAARFDPDRFLPARTAGRHRFAYFPFAAGPRQCIGEPFALLEMTLVVAAIGRRFRLTPMHPGPLVPEPLVTLRPRDGVPMRVARREGS
jgi:cytochrome P450